MMKKYVCPMGCLSADKAGVEPQDHPGNCPECGIKLLEMQTKQTLRRLGRQYSDYADIVNNYSAKSAFHSASSAFLKKFWFSLIFTLIVIFVSFTPYESIARDFRKS
jgi:hypothetical protein